MNHPRLQRRRLTSIDMLRGIAVLSVLLCHLPFSTRYGGGSVFPAWLNAALERGHSGVDLFLVLSGFCIHRSAQRVTFTAFWKRRLYRLYPPYFVALVGSIVGVYVLAQVAHVPVELRAVDMILLVLLLQNLNGAAFRVGNGPFWTLALEEQLYLLYFPLLWMRRRYGWLITTCIVLAVTVAFRALVSHAIGPGRWIEWTLGAVAADVAASELTLPKCLSSPLVGLSILFVALWTNNDLVYAPAFFVLVNAAVKAESQVWIARALAFVGLWSYSLYLTHEPTMVAAKYLAIRVGLGIVGIVVLRIAVPLLCAYLFHRLIQVRYMSRPSSVRERGSSLAA